MNNEHDRLQQERTEILQQLERIGHRDSWGDKELNIDTETDEAEDLLNRLRDNSNKRHNPAPAPDNPIRQYIPSLITEDGTQQWRNDQFQLHRDGAPAVLKPDGTEEWYQNGKKHREDGPAQTDPDGTEWWYQHGQVHRDGAPAVTSPDGTEEWYQHDQHHRDGSPAVIDPDGSNEWYQNGQLHREDGPAATYLSENTVEYWLNGKHYPDVKTDTEWEQIIHQQQH